MADEVETGDDVGWWDCSLCTYRNASEKFKCEICDLRRGTSTRKPRCNADTIVAQVVKQQEQIRQQTRVVKSSPKSRSSATSVANNNDNLIAATSSNESTLKVHRKNPGLSQSGATSDSSQSDSWPKPEKKKKKLLHKKSKSSRKKSTHDLNENNNNNNNEAADELDSSASDSSEATDELSRASSYQSDSESYLEGHNDSPISPNEATTSSPNHSNKTTENPFKIIPLEISGNLIKYSPPTSTGRTGLIIDKKRFTQHSVTVNDVTITFTEFATRQNKYIRKKKKRRDDRHRGNGNNGKNVRSTHLAPASSSATTIATTTTTAEKSEPKSSNYNPAATAGD